MVKVKKQWIAAALCLSLLLAGCAQDVPAAALQGETGTVQTEETQPQGTIPPDGNPDDVTCKGSYTGGENPEQVVATVGDAELTNGQLAAYYWAAVGAYRENHPESTLDFQGDLAMQPCEIDSSVASWQQYFLRQALQLWHTSQALELKGEEEGVPTEEAFQPNAENHEKYMVDIPATKYLYGYYDDYHPNTMHQEFLDNIGQMLQQLARELGYADETDLARQVFGTTAEDAEEFVRLYNWGYMYYTTLGYDLDPSEEEIEEYLQSQGLTIPEEDETCVTLHHILLVPESDEESEESVTVAADGKVTCSEASWAQCQTEAEALLKKWRGGTWVTEATFANLAHSNSRDEGSAADGGVYYNLRQGQLIEPLNEWAFSPERKSGDTTILRSDYGIHILYFSGSSTVTWQEARNSLWGQKNAQVLETAVAAYPIQVDYSAITLPGGTAEVSLSDVLYPDVAHERFPEVPLYLQQDYGVTMFGSFRLATNGCGITSMAMVSSYLSDEEWTPPELCDKYGYYSFKNGTDGMIFINEPPVLGFYLREKTYDPEVARQALADGHIVVSIQHKGYWTSGGHYIVLEKLNEDGTVQVRDSNLYNYSQTKIPAHSQDRHAWSDITSAGSGYWIFEYKVTRIPACSRCGEPENIAPAILTDDYCCHKCSEALLRRQTYLSLAEA